MLPAVRESSSSFAESKPLHEIFDSNDAKALEDAVAKELGGDYIKLKSAIVAADAAIDALAADASQSQKEDADQALEDALKAFDGKVMELVSASRAAATSSEPAEPAESAESSEPADEEKVEESSGMSTGAIVGIAVGSVAGVGLIAAVIVVLACKGQTGGRSGKYSQLSSNELWDRNRFAPSY